MIFAESERAVYGIPESKTKFIEGKFFQQITHDKTKIDRLGIFPMFSGFGSYQTADGWKVSVHKKSRDKFTKKMREILTRKCPRGKQIPLKQFNIVLKRDNYFRLCISKSHMNREMLG